MIRRVSIVVVAALFLATGCRASEAGARDDDAPTAKAEAESPDESSTEPVETDGEQTEGDQTEGDQTSEPAKSPTRVQLEQLAKTTLSEIQGADIHARWTSASEAGSTPVIGWYGFDKKGGDNMGPSASSLRSRLETMSVNDLPVDVAGLGMMARNKGVDLSSMQATTQVGILRELAAKLDLEYAASGTLIRDTSTGEARFGLRVVIVEGATGEPVFDTTSMLE